ncbi:MAG TPA: DNA primase [Casimicrobiaceae bacterium]|nr:DNA primase [Casimicrobiaceae bacterium]
MIPNDFIQTLLARVDIVEVVDRFVPLKKAGANYQACCPFHSEKTPSFTVSPTKQFYHCFGCGAHGTAIGFLMEHAGRSFPDAVEELARDAGLEVPRTERPGEREERRAHDDLTGRLAAAAKFYRTELRSAPRAIEYLKARGLTGAIAAHFAIGYAPDEWTALERAFPDYQDASLETAGLVVKGDGGKRYDRFRDRIMFPIHDARGRIVGFGGRVLDRGEPKYLNSPETPLFSKGRELYGLWLARNAIREHERVVVVEGYMDVVALAQHGVEYAVATLGTATTAAHAQKLFRLTDHVVFCFDGDAAGRKAAWRALENTLPVLADGKEARFLFLPDGEDPDDYVRRRGRAAFEEALASATPLSGFLVAELSARHPPDTDEGRAAFVAAARPLVSQIAAPILAALITRRIAEIAGLSDAQVAPIVQAPVRPARDEVPDARSRSADADPAFRPRRGTRSPVRRAPSLARQLLQAILLQPSIVRDVDIPPAGENSPDAAALAAVVAWCAGAGATITTAGIMQAFEGSEHDAALVAALASAEDQGISPEQAATHLREGVERWRAQEEQRQIASLLATPLDQLTAEQKDLVRRRMGALGRVPKDSAA